MKLGDYVKNLQDIVEKNPEYSELDVIYARDDEGNGYQHVVFSPSLGINSTEGFCYAEFENYDEDEHELDEVNCVCVN